MLIETQSIISLKQRDYSIEEYDKMVEKTAIFIDGGYLIKLCAHRIDFRKLLDKLLGPKELYRAYYYNCLPYIPQNPTVKDKEKIAKAQKFNKYLNSIPHFSVKLGKLKFKGYDASGIPITVQKRVDLMLGLDIASVVLIQPRIVNTVILLTGDSDMLPAVEISQNANHIVILAHGDKSTYDQELWDSADERIYMDAAFFKSVEYTP
jgi:uncharacterized LabA/DUF88 family protein